jgi:hypothetical protein
MRANMDSTVYLIKVLIGMKALLTGAFKSTP